MVLRIQKGRKGEGLIKFMVLPRRGLRISLLSCHIDGKLMCVLCRASAETTNCGVCSHTSSERYITGTWVSVGLQKALAIRYVIVAIYEAWNHDETTVYDQDTIEGGLFALYMNSFVKMEASGNPVGCKINQISSSAYVHTRECI